MFLYHFTKSGRDNIGCILKDQEIRPHDWFPDPLSSIQSFNLIWLTEDPQPHRHPWAKGRNIRIAVDVPKSKITRWDEFARRNKITDAFSRSHAIGTPSLWLVAMEPIPRERWVEIVLLDTAGHEREIIEVH